MARACVGMELAYPAERVWEIVTDLARQNWRSDIDRVETVGAGAFVEYARGGVITAFTVTRWEPPRVWAFDLENREYKRPLDGGNFFPPPAAAR